VKSLGRLLALLALLSLLATAGAAAAPFKTGLYVGMTSQHKPFSFYVKTTRECGRRAGLCLYTKTQAYISEPCTNGTETNAYADPGPLIVGKSGIVKETLNLFSTVVIYIKLGHNGTASGRFTATDTEEGLSCSSGTVTFTAKRH